MRKMAKLIMYSGLLGLTMILRTREPNLLAASRTNFFVNARCTDTAHERNH
jgi:hypothetical protein